MVAGKFRVRVKNSSKSSLPRGGSSASNPKSSRHRDAAIAQRIANKYPLIAVEDRLAPPKLAADAALLKNVPMGEISLGNKKGKRHNVSKSIADSDENGKKLVANGLAILEQISKLSLLEKEGAEIDQTAAVELLEQLELALNVQNVKSWPAIIHNVTALVDKVGSTLIGPSFTRLMNTVAQLRDRDDCLIAKNIDELFAVAVRSVGLEELLAGVPLNIDVEAPMLPQDFKRSWLLPILAKNARGGSLDFFTRTIIPLAMHLYQRIPQLPELPRKLYTALEHQLWTMLPRCLATDPCDFHASIATLAPIMGAVLNDRPDLRLTMLKAIRAALHFDAANGGVRMMEKYARNFMPILFSIYTNVEEQSSSHIIVDNGAIQKSALETIRLYVQHLPQSLFANYVSLAVKKLSLATSDDNQNEFSERKYLLADLLVALSRKAGANDLGAIFDCAQLWLDHSHGRVQKKAYRILAEIYRRIEESELQQFFDKKFQFLESLVSKGIADLDKSVFPWRIAIYRSIIGSFNEFSALSHFSNSISAEIVAFFQRANNQATRRQAALCLSEMTSSLIRLGLIRDEEVSASEALEPLFTKLFGEVKASKSGDETSFQCSLIALNILTQKYCRLMNATLISQIIGHTGYAIRITPSATRLLPIRILRILSAKLEPFMFDQYKDLIIEAVFSQNTKDVTSRTRKANALLLEQLLSRLELGTLLKSVGDRWVWQKQLKNIEKARRRRQRRLKKDDGEEEDNKDDDMEGGRRHSSSGATSRVGASSRVSSATWASGAQTAKVDSIFDILADSSEEDEEEEASVYKKMERKASRPKGTSHLSVVIEEDEDEMLDLLDQKSMLHKVSLVEEAPRKFVKIGGKQKRLKQRPGRRRCTNKGEEEEKQSGGERGGGPFRMNKEGKLLITDLDKKRKGRRKRASAPEGEKEEEEREKKAGGKRRKGGPETGSEMESRMTE